MLVIAVTESRVTELDDEGMTDEALGVDAGVSDVELGVTLGLKVVGALESFAEFDEDGTGDASVALVAGLWLAASDGDWLGVVT